MNTNFSSQESGSPDKIVFEQVWGEKPGGGRVGNPAFDVLPGTAVGKNSSGILTAIKGYRLLKAVAVEDTTIEIAKGSGAAVGDVIGIGKVAVACTAVDTTTHLTKDVVTVTLGVAVAIDKVLYQAAEASADAAEVIYTPEYVTGNTVFAGKGDQPVRLVNGANVRKETANFGADVCALLKSINLV